jgi:hypothetical protein
MTQKHRGSLLVLTLTGLLSGALTPSGEAGFIKVTEAEPGS